MQDRVFVGGGGEGYGQPQDLLLKMGNRHGLMAGATGTGKTVTLQVLAEGFSAAGVPVFMSDVKGDLSGLPPRIGRRTSCTAPLPNGPKRSGWICSIGLSGDLLGSVRRTGPPDPHHRGRDGAPAAVAPAGIDRTAGRVLNVAFRLADEEGMPLLDLKDLQGASDLHRGKRPRGRRALWACVHHLGRGDPAPPAGAGKSGRGQPFRRTGAGSGRHDDAGRQGAGASRSLRRTS
jgi:hypothetical protein